MKTRTWLVGTILLYLIASILPACGGPGHDGRDGIRGIYCLILVPWVLFIPAWHANPLLLAGGIALARGKVRLARRLGLVATLLAASFAWMTGVDGLRPGFFFWFASIAGLVAATFEPHRAGLRTIKPIPEDELGPIRWDGFVAPRGQKTPLPRE